MNDTAIILAAGIGRRLHPLTLKKPKCLLELNGQTFLSRTITSCLQENIKYFIIVVGFEKQQIIDHVQKKFPSLSVHFVTNNQFYETNTGYSLFLALEHSQKPFILFDGDLVFDPKILHLCLKAPYQHVMMVDTNRNKLDGEALKIITATDHSLNQLGKAIPLTQATGEFIGLLRFSENFTSLLYKTMKAIFSDPRHAQLYYEDVISSILGEEEKVFAIPTNGLLWSEVDTLDDFTAIASQKSFV